LAAPRHRLPVSLDDDPACPLYAHLKWDLTRGTHCNSKVINTT